MPDWDDEDNPVVWDDNEPVVCMTHKRFLPCRVCYEDMSESGTWSALPSDIEKVRQYQNSGITRIPAREALDVQHP